MNTIQKSESMLRELQNDFFEGKITKEKFEELSSFPASVLEKAKAKKIIDDIKAVGTMSREDHMALEKRILAEREEYDKLHQDLPVNKSPEEVAELVQKVKAGGYNHINKEIANMTREEHKIFMEEVEGINKSSN